MPSLLSGVTPTPLTLPLSSLARLDANQLAWLRECLASVQDEYLRTEFACMYAASEVRERQAHEAEAVRELLVDAWLDALCPLPVFYAPAKARGTRN